MADPLYAFRLPPELKDALAKLTARDGIAASEAIRRGLVAFLKQRGIAVKPAKTGGKKEPNTRSR